MESNNASMSAQCWAVLVLLVATRLSIGGEEAEKVGLFGHIFVFSHITRDPFPLPRDDIRERARFRIDVNPCD